MTEVVARLNAEQLRDLEAFCSSQSNAPLLPILLEEFKAQRNALDIVRQYVDSFRDADGTANDVADLVADLKEVLDGVETVDPPRNPDSESRLEKHH